MPFTMVLNSRKLQVPIIITWFVRSCVQYSNGFLALHHASVRMRGIFTSTSLNAQVSTQLLDSSSMLSCCYDDLCDAQQLNWITKGGQLRSHSFTSVFDRYEKPRSVLEAFIVQLLDKLDLLQETEDHKASGRYVEYWYRHSDTKTMRMLEAHRDIDEVFAKQNQIPSSLGSDIKFGLQKCPTYGHVVYVNVSPELRAPTLLFEEDKIVISETYDSKFQHHEHNSGGPPGIFTSLWSVPAVTNRLLRFRGDAIHAVSYPCTGFLLNKTLEISAALESDHMERTVLLFNTWNEAPLYPPIQEPLSKKECEYWYQMNASSSSSVQEDAGPILCKPIEAWSRASPVFMETKNRTMNELSGLRVPLLGGISRRACMSDTIHQYVDHTDAIQAFVSNSTIYGIKLYE